MRLRPAREFIHPAYWAELSETEGAICAALDEHVDVQLLKIASGTIQARIGGYFCGGVTGFTGGESPGESVCIDMLRRRVPDYVDRYRRLVAYWAA